MGLHYDCPSDCEHRSDPTHDPFRCINGRPMECCLVHTIFHPVGQPCPTCAAYIAAGL